MGGVGARSCGAPGILEGGFWGAPEAGNASVSTDGVGGIMTDPWRSLLRGGVRRAQTGPSGWPGVLPARRAGVARAGLPAAGRGARAAAGEAFSFSQRSAERGGHASPGRESRALQARPLAGVAGQGTGAPGAALAGSSPCRERWALLRVASASTAAAWP